MKTCGKCGETKDLELFAKRRPDCKACEAARARRFRAENSELVRQRDAARRAGEREQRRARGRRYHAENSAVRSEKNKQWRAANEEVLQEKKRLKYAATAEAQRAGKKLYYLENKGQCMANAAKRRALVLQRTPKWLTTEDYAQIRTIYAESARLTEETGVLHHVDHIIPLQGKTMSGLHAPWNLRVIPATENLQKKNRYDGPDSWAA